MNLIADENIEQQIVNRLRQDGHRVISVAEMEPGISDGVVMQLANQRKALLMTSDKDFGELVFRQGLVHMGVALFRLAGQSLPSKANMVSSAFSVHGSEMMGAFSVISPGLVRIRQKQS